MNEEEIEDSKNNQIIHHYLFKDYFQILKQKHQK